MKKLILFALLAIGAAFAAPTFYNRTGATADKKTEVVTTEEFALLVFDALIPQGDTVYSRPVDMIHVPVNYRDTGIGDAVLLYDQSMGTTVLSCYDAVDDLTATDSTDISATIQLSQYAGDNMDPNGTGEQGGKSDAWASASPYTINAASDAQAVNESPQAVAFTSPLDRFVRWKFVNNNVTAKDKSRCRLYWTHKRVKR